MSDFKFYSLDRIENEVPEAKYYMIFGERSNGKTSAVLERILINWIEKGEQGVYLRRYDEEIKGSKGEQIYSSIADERGLVEKYTKGKYTSVTYYNRKFYLSKWDEKLQRNVRQSEPFCHAMAINQMEHHKGTGYPLVTTVCFDEFLSRRIYMIDEFVEFQNTISTIVRQRDNVTIYMLGNTVNKYSPYFDEMGLTDITEMKQGDIRKYVYNNDEGDNKLVVAVEYSGSVDQKKKSDVYFAFNNPKLQMITSGEWELPMYPHAPFKIKQKNILDVFFIDFRDTILQGDIVLQDKSLFIYIHKKTTPIKDDKKMIYSLSFNPRYNHAVSIISKPRNKMAVKIAELFRNDLVYYQNNSIGELVRNYIQESESRTSTNL